MVGSNPNLVGVGEGEYTLTVEDENGCTDELIFEVVLRSRLPKFIEPTVTNASCGVADGSLIGAGATGGTGTVTFEWTYSDGTFISNDTDLDGYGADTYVLTITDDKWL